MKKFFLVIISGILIFTGCSKSNDDVLKKLTNKLKKVNSYEIQGVLEITNNEAVYKYDIDAKYEKKDKYNVSFKNKINDHEQIILRNTDGIYVLTPALNKCFKFQSDWPYNSSQSYLYQSILSDLERDDNVKITKAKDGYIIQVKVNYENRNDLLYEKIYIDNKANIKKVEVFNNEDIVKIKMTYNKVKENVTFNDDTFKVNMKENEKAKSSIKTLDVAYPLYLPKNTKLESSKILENEGGQRTVLTFAGEKPFTIIEQIASTDSEVISMDGEIELVNDVFGNLEDKSVSWISDGIEYYAVASNMEKEELLKVVNSINNLPSGK